MDIALSGDNGSSKTKTLVIYPTYSPNVTNYVRDQIKLANPYETLFYKVICDFTTCIGDSIYEG